MTVKTLIASLVLSAVLAPFGGNAHRKTEQGNVDYEAGEYENALKNYTEAQVDLPESPELYYDIGNVLYRQGDPEGAAESYTRALLTAREQLVPLAAYNLGNARFAQQDYKEAIKAYQRALRAEPGDVQAKRNLELALRALQEQPRQQKPSPGDSEQNEPQEQEQQQGQGEQGEQDEEQEQPGEQGQDPEDQQRQTGSESDTEADPQRMSQEQARRLLDSLKDQERDELRRLRTTGPEPAREKDW